MIKSLFQQFREIIMYGVIGVICVLIDLCVYTVLFNLTDNYLISNVLSVTIGILCSFTLNRAFTFKIKDRTIKRLITFFLVGMIGLGISSSILFVLIENMHTSEIVAKLIAIVVVSITQFLLNKFITFKRS